MDAVVVDSHCLPRDRAQTVARLLVRKVAFASESKPMRTSLVILASPRFSSRLKYDCERVGAVVLPIGTQSYRHIARTVRRMRGLPDRCCLRHFAKP
ncbi:MAG: hypothetical protein ABS36_06285 [Acidobacteria bacterium SCN 69-37]|nr:MAG: hypothetical protein ABS36_06285 [Acidobacteria bacterium SCN 69-37]